MIQAKQIFDAVEPQDGFRIWVEPFGLTLDLFEWCQVTSVSAHLGPPIELWEWFQQHPEGYEYFRGEYHNCLENSPYLPELLKLAKAGTNRNFTLLHQENDPEHNTAVALYEFLSELAARCGPE